MNTHKRTNKNRLTTLATLTTLLALLPATLPQTNGQEPTNTSNTSETTNPTITLDPNTLYVIESNVHTLVISSPEGVVRIGEENGPIRIRARFHDSTQPSETRTFKSNYVFIVEAQNNGTCEVLVIPTNSKNAQQITRIKIHSTIKQQPLPPPSPPPSPPQPPKEAPIPEPGLRVLIIFNNNEDQIAKLHPEHYKMIFGTEFRQFLLNACTKGPNDKTPECRIWPHNVDTSFEKPLWNKAYKRPRTSLPWIIISNGTDGYEGPLPTSTQETQELIKKYQTTNP